MSLSFLMSFDEFKTLALPFAGIFIPLLIAYKIGKKTNLLVALLTIVLYSLVIMKFEADIKGINEPLGTLLQETAEVYFSPVILIFTGALEFLGLSGTMDPLVICAGLFAVFFVLALISKVAAPIRFINKIITSLLGLAVLAVAVLYILG